MKRSAQKAIILAVGVVFVIMLIEGCEEQSLSDTKKHRLIAAQNRQLKEQLEQRDAEIGNRDAEIKKQKKLLEKCRQKKDALKTESKRNFQDQVNEVLNTVMEENVKLRQEVESLKVQIEKLKKQSGS